jgi:hypothetical protein
MARSFAGRAASSWTPVREVQSPTRLSLPSKAEVGPRQRAKVGALGQGNFRATYDGEKTEFLVREGATEMQLPGITRDPAMRLWG